VVGSSGAGKSTLFKLLTRERVPSAGSIGIDDVDLHDIQFRSYFENIGVMLQETELFSFTLKENVTLATEDIDEERFARAIKISRVDDFVDKLPQSVDTVIGEKGFKLSGGERQRVGIARAIYHQPQIIFFDEATSHLDVESEKKIQAALEDLFETTTALVIAHRLSTIQEMDRILVMEEGKIVEEGSFQELLDAKGRFYDLWQQQQL
jgi:ABC-type multidrug transport system fused ATPase/permease subunit